MTNNPVTTGIETVGKVTDLATLILGPSYTKKQHEVMMKVLKDYSDFINSHPELEVRIENNNISMRSRENFDFINNAYLRSAIETIIKECNYQNILENAKKEFEINEDECEINLEKFDLNWYLKFSEISRNISDDNLQQLWGRILSNEGRSPGKYNLRFLDFLMNISTDEAILIQKISLLVIDGDFINSDIDLLAKYDIRLQDICLLQEIGFLANDQFVKTFNINHNRVDMYLKNYCIQLKGSTGFDKINNVDQDGYLLTSIGKRVIELFATESSISELLKFIEYLKNKYRNTNFTIYKTFKLKGSSITQLGEMIEFKL